MTARLETPRTDAGPAGRDAPFLHRGALVPFVLLVSCFAAWGTAANLTDPLVGVFRIIFTMSSLQAALVQFSYYGAYFCLALPAAFINRRFSYKTGVLLGLGLAVLGAAMFYPAAQIMQYGPFLAALFVLAGGLSNQGTRTAGRELQREGVDRRCVAGASLPLTWRTARVWQLTARRP